MSEWTRDELLDVIEGVMNQFGDRDTPGWRGTQCLSALRTVAEVLVDAGRWEEKPGGRGRWRDYRKISESP